VTAGLGGPVWSVPQGWNGTDWINLSAVSLTTKDAGVIASPGYITMYDGDWDSYAFYLAGTWYTSSDASSIRYARIYEENITWTVRNINSNNAFNYNLTNLNSGTLYHYRSWSNNSYDYSYGDDVTFKTKYNLTYQPWDINQDGKVNYLDLSLLVSKYGEAGWIHEDINWDNSVDYLDLSLLVTHYGEEY
jgi:hypothetical protein